jgi:hypothetical protein
MFLSCKILSYCKTIKELYQKQQKISFCLGDKSFPHYSMYNSPNLNENYFFSLIGGYLSEKYGGKWFLCIGSLVTAVFTLLTPIAAKQGTTALIAVRIIEGLGEVRK